MDHTIYTGTIKYNQYDFTYVFDHNLLRLIPTPGKSDEIITNWFMKELAKGTYTFGPLPKMETPFLIGWCNETGAKLIFLPWRGANISRENSVLLVRIAAFIECRSKNQSISKISFTSPELDCIYPVTQGYSCYFDTQGVNSTGVIKVQTEDFSETTTEKRTFTIDGIEVQVSFGISRSFSTSVGQPPLSLHSTMIMEFAPTEDYAFLMRAWFVAKEFIQYMCYRRNVFLPSAVLSTPAGNGMTRQCATLFVLGETGDNEFEVLKNGRYIKLPHLLGHEHQILNDIAARTLYTRHLPDTYESGNRINAARFVMTTAAFEWEFSRSYPDGIKKSESTLKAEQEAAAAIQKLIDDSKTSKVRSIYKFLYKLTSSSSLQSEVIHIGKNMDTIIGIFGQRLYSLNNTELLYSEIGKRIADQRNHYAHGDLDIDFIDLALLDVVYLERIIYAMQLQFYGVEAKSIQQAVNELFACGVYIP
jgi:hypothetical protein